MGDTVTISQKDPTIAEMIKFMETEYNVEVQIVSAGVSCIYNAFSKTSKDRLNRKVKEVYEEITKTEIIKGRNYIKLEVTAVDCEDDVDVTTPTLKLVFA